MKQKITRNLVFASKVNKDETEAEFVARVYGSNVDPKQVMEGLWAEELRESAQANSRESDFDIRDERR